ncbi:MAG: ABC transporter ATP-binding protein [Akkermansia sp.]|nr:ABC transporter ATP-binding protein [Akkermansia sp.]MBQ6942058.1 ABC transporter ATP-binding protein [Akkermansia sp.]
MAYLELQNVSVHYPVRDTWGTTGEVVRAVDDVSLSVERGQILGLVGESGCGKSTLSRAIMQLQPVTSGRIVLRGEDLTALPAREIRKRRLDFQMVFQDPYASLNPRFSIFSTLVEALSCREKLPRHRREEAVAELMNRVGLSPEHMYKYPHEFSGGQRQRIAIARAIAPRPALLLADEPVSALDVSIQSQILNLLTDLTRELGLTMIFISHDLSVVHYLADEIAVMRRGKIVEYGSAENVFHSPQAEYTRKLLAAIPRLFPAT